MDIERVVDLPGIGIVEPNGFLPVMPGRNDSAIKTVSGRCAAVIDNLGRCCARPIE